jgi:hypothetical protein
VYLTKEQERIFNGEEGETKELAMKVLVAIGDVYEAPRMIDVRSAQISGVSYKTIGDPGLEFLREFSSGKARAIVKAMVNPAGMDLVRWVELGIPEEFARKQLEIMQCFSKMGIEPTCTCIPYSGEAAPLREEHLAWAESSAVVFANSVLGAYTNREGGPTALASSVLGLTPLYGMHIDENRTPTHLVKMKCQLKSDLDYSLLGYWIGRNLGSCIPRIQGLPALCPHDRLKSLGASMAASGSVAMFSTEENGESKNAETVTVDRKELLEVGRLLSSERDFEHVALGCPHLSLEELKAVADLVSGRRLAKDLWCFTSRHLRDVAKTRGYVDAIESSGGKVICDTCIVVSPMTEKGMEGLVTNSCKAAHYLRSLNRVETRLMSFEGCVQHALL